MGEKEDNMENGIDMFHNRDAFIQMNLSHEN